MSGIFSDDFVLDSLTPEDEEAMKDLEVPEEGENLEEAVVTEGPEEGGEGKPQEAPTAEGQPSTEKPGSLAKFKSDFALAKSYAEIKKALGEPNDLERYTTREELEQAYLEAERRLGSRGKTTTTQPQPAQDDRYQALEKQLAQTQGVLNQLATMIFQQSQAPQNQEPQIPPEEQNFIQEMEELYPGFSQCLERLIAQKVTPQLAPLQKLASEYEQQVKFVQGWQNVAARNADFKEYVPEIKAQIQQLAQENPALFNALQQQPEALYEFAYARAKTAKAGQIQQQVTEEVSTALQQAAEEQAQLEAQKQAAAMPKPGVKTTPKQKTIEEIVSEEILSTAQGGGIFDGLI